MKISTSNSAPNAHDKFLKIKTAYDILSDESKKRDYDATLRAKKTAFHNFHHNTTYTHYTASGSSTFVFNSYQRSQPKMTKSYEFEQKQKQQGNKVKNSITND